MYKKLISILLLTLTACSTASVLQAQVYEPYITQDYIDNHQSIIGSKGQKKLLVVILDFIMGTEENKELWNTDEQGALARNSQDPWLIPRSNIVATVSSRFNGLSSYLRESSYGSFDIATTVVGPAPLPWIQGTKGEDGRVRGCLDERRGGYAWLEEQGIDPSTFDDVILVNMSCNTSSSWTSRGWWRRTLSTGVHPVQLHELVHKYLREGHPTNMLCGEKTLDYPWNCELGFVGDTGLVDVITGQTPKRWYYGYTSNSKYTPVGVSAILHPSAWEKFRAGWFNYGGKSRAKLITESGKYFVKPYWKTIPSNEEGYNTLVIEIKKMRKYQRGALLFLSYRPVGGSWERATTSTSMDGEDGLIGDMGFLIGRKGVSTKWGMDSMGGSHLHLDFSPYMKYSGLDAKNLMQSSASISQHISRDGELIGWHEFYKARYRKYDPAYLDLIPATINVRRIDYGNYLEVDVTMHPYTEELPPANSVNVLDAARGTIRILDFDIPEEHQRNVLAHIPLTIENLNEFPVHGVASRVMVCKEDMTSCTGGQSNQWHKLIDCPGNAPGVVPPGVCTAMVDFYKEASKDVTIGIKVALQAIRDDVEYDSTDRNEYDARYIEGTWTELPEGHNRIRLVEHPGATATTIPTAINTVIVPTATKTNVPDSTNTVMVPTATKTTPPNITNTATIPTATKTNTSIPNTPTKTSTLIADPMITSPLNGSVFVIKSEIKFSASLPNDTKKVKFKAQRNSDGNYNNMCERKKAPWTCTKNIDKPGEYIIGIEIESSDGRKTHMYGLSAFTVKRNISVISNPTP